MSTRFRTTLAAVALAGALALTGCSSTSGGSSDSSSSSGAGDSAGSSQTTAAKEDSAAKETTAAPAAPEVPAGHKEVTAPTAGITVAVPEDWRNVGELSDEELQAIADLTGSSPETYKTQLEQLDLFVTASTPDENGFSSNLNVAKQTVPTTTLPSEAEVQALLAQQTATMDSYETVQTANGEGVVSAYSLTQGEISAKGSLLLLPNADKQFTIIFVSASTAEKAKEISDNVVASAH
ncbi:hypothetical protein NSA19_04645 [Actinomyces bowdenii]|uniref:hypothetical protein n=1 Tax=Actinomyces bowdenii TaxID=131109 RepID=UPI00214CB5B6|nr:hypothetical protein [Actinomyces bowdenii]MCR2052145.1 hypothetical protein [Actinomyces bowdenii]